MLLVLELVAGVVFVLHDSRKWVDISCVMLSYYPNISPLADDGGDE